MQKPIQLNVFSLFLRQDIIIVSIQPLGRNVARTGAQRHGVLLGQWLYCFTKALDRRKIKGNDLGLREAFKQSQLDWRPAGGTLLPSAYSSLQWFAGRPQTSELPLSQVVTSDAAYWWLIYTSDTFVRSEDLLAIGLTVLSCLGRQNLVIHQIKTFCSSLAD